MDGKGSEDSTSITEEILAADDFQGTDNMFNLTMWLQAGLPCSSGWPYILGNIKRTCEYLKNKNVGHEVEDSWRGEVGSERWSSMWV